MASKISELVVSLGLNTASFSQKISEVNRSMKLFDSQFKNSGAGVKNFEKSMAGLGAKLKNLNQHMDGARTKIKLYKDEINKTKTALEQNTSKMEKSRQKVADLKKQYEDSVKTLGRNAEATKKLKEEYTQAEVELNKHEKAVLNNSNRLKKLETDLNNTEADLKKFAEQAKATENQMKNLHFEQLSKKLEKVSGKFKKAGDQMIGMGKKMSIISGAIAGVGIGAIKTAADFEQGMAKVQAISGASGQDLEKLSEKAKEMGAKTKFSAIESAEALSYMAMAGWKTNDMLNGLEGIMNLAAASGEDLAMVSDIVTDALTAFGMQANQSAEFADVLAAASSNSNTNVAMLGESFRYAAPVAGALKYNVQDTAVALGLMANAGIKATQAGTALRTGLTNLAKPTKNMQKAMDKYGISLKDNKGHMKSMSQVMRDLREKLGKLDEQTKAATVAQIFGKEAMSGWLAIINASESDFVKLTNSIKDSSGASKEMADIMNKTAQGQLILLKSQLEGLAISVGEKLLPHVNNLIKKLSDLMTWFGNLSQSTQSTIVTIAGLTAAIGPLLIMFGSITKGLGSIIGLFGKAAGACAGMSTVMKGTTAATTGTVGGITKLVGAFVSLNPVVLGVTAAIAALAAGAVIYTTNNEVMSQSILKTTDEMTGFEKLLDQLNGGFSKSKAELQSMGLVYKDFNKNVSEEFKKKVEESTDKINKFTLEVEKVNFDKVLTKEESQGLKDRVTQMCDGAIATIKDKQKESNESMKKMFLDDNVLDKTEKDILSFLSRTSQSQITEINKLKGEIYKIWDNAVKGKRELNEQEIADVQSKVDRICQIELEAQGKNQEELLYAKNEFLARVQSIDLEGASKLMEEKAKLRDEERVKIESFYNTNIDLLKSKLSEANDEEKAKIQEKIEAAEKARDEKLKIESDLYQGYLQILAEKNPEILSQINMFNGEILTKQDLKKQEVLKKQAEELEGINEITESGYYELHNKTTNGWDKVIVTVDKSTGKITGILNTHTNQVGGYTDNICEDLKKQGREYKDSAQKADVAMRDINGATVKNGEIVQGALGKVIGKLQDVKKTGDHTKRGIIELNGTPIELEFHDNGTITNLDEIKSKMGNLPTFKKITVQIAATGKAIMDKVAGFFGARSAPSVQMPPVESYVPTSIKTPMTFGSYATKEIQPMTTGFSIDVPQALKDVNSGYQQVGSTFVKQITTTAKNSVGRKDQDITINGGAGSGDSETNKLLKKLVETMLNGGIVVQAPVYLNGRQIAMASSPYMDAEMKNLKLRKDRLGGNY